MIQVKAGLIKEWLYFWRRFRFLGLLITFVGCAVTYPAMAWFMRITGDALEQMGENAELAEAGVSVDGMAQLMNMFTKELTYAGSLMMFTSTAIIVILILLIGAAGGEQKKRSIVLPQTAGLTPAGYVLPKFLLFPPLVFVLTLLSALMANVATQIVFKSAISLDTVMLTGTLHGVFMMFLTCLYLFLGVSLTQPGLAVIYVFGGHSIIELMLMYVFEVDRFTPWNLTFMSLDMVMLGRDSVATSAMAATVAITLVLCVALAGLTLFAMIAKRMDNTANEIY